MMRLDGLILFVFAVGMLVAAFASPRREPARQAGCHLSVLPECAGSQR